MGEGLSSYSPVGYCCFLLTSRFTWETVKGNSAFFWFSLRIKASESTLWVPSPAFLLWIYILCYGSQILPCMSSMFWDAGNSLSLTKQKTSTVGIKNPKFRIWGRGADSVFWVCHEPGSLETAALCLTSSQSKWTWLLLSPWGAKGKVCSHSIPALEALLPV